MLVQILKLIFGKIIGIDNIPKEKREEFWKRLGAYSIKLAREMAQGAGEGIAQGAVEGAKNR